MPNFSEKLVDEYLERAMVLERYKSGLNRDVQKILQQLQADVIRELDTLDPNAVKPSFRQRRLLALEKRVNQIIGSKYGEVATLHGKSIGELAIIEAQFARQSFNLALGFNLLDVDVAPEKLREIARNSLIEGAPSREWWSGQSRKLKSDFKNTVRLGMLRGDSTEKIARAFRHGSASVMSVSKRQAESLVRTSVQTVSNNARLEGISSFGEVVNGVQWVSTLDNRTSPVCRVLDGKKFDKERNPVGHTMSWPGSTAHWGCRSTQIPWVKSWEELTGASIDTPEGRKTFKSAYQSELRRSGLDAKQRAAATARTRASMDGQVSDTLTYEEWLKGKSDSFQDRVLGKTKGELFREEGLTLRQMVDTNGRPLNLDQLRRKLDD